VLRQIKRKGAAMTFPFDMPNEETCRRLEKYGIMVFAFWVAWSMYSDFRTQIREMAPAIKQLADSVKQDVVPVGKEILANQKQVLDNTTKTLENSNATAKAMEEQVSECESMRHYHNDALARHTELLTAVQANSAALKATSSGIHSLLKDRAIE
jgi:hypothetical protein